MAKKPLPNFPWVSCFFYPPRSALPCKISPNRLGALKLPRVLRAGPPSLLSAPLPEAR